MNISQAKEEIKNTVCAYLSKNARGEYKIPAIRQRPIFLIGPPGIGKTQIMEQIARECKIALVSYTITHHTRQSAVGLPFIMEEEFEGKKYSVTEYTMSEIIASVYRKQRDTGIKEGILFIDEINCVSETLAPTMLQFLQCKMFGNQSIPEGWIIVAAGNPPEYNKSVRQFDMVTLDRVRCIPVEADLTVWKKYARESGVHPAIISYLEIRPNNFYKVENSVDGMEFVTARGWEDLSSLLQIYEEMKIPVGKDIVYEFLKHEDVAEDVAAYIELYQKYQDDYNIKDILAGNITPEIYQRLDKAALDERLSVVNLLLDALFERFKEIGTAKFIADEWYGFLKEYRRCVGTRDSCAQSYAEAYSEYKEKADKTLESGFYNQAQRGAIIWLLNKLLESTPDSEQPRESFEQAREPFKYHTAELETAWELVGNNLESAFDLMENAFGQGEEMVVFVTELALSPVAVEFLSDYSCERYMKYNERLLVGSRRGELLAELDR